MTINRPGWGPLGPPSPTGRLRHPSLVTIQVHALNPSTLRAFASISDSGVFPARSWS